MTVRELMELVVHGTKVVLKDQRYGIEYRGVCGFQDRTVTAIETKAKTSPNKDFSYPVLVAWIDNGANDDIPF